MKIYDFDAKFYDYVATWIALHPGLKEDEIEARYNEMMLSWLNAPAQWLGGVRPGEYFNRYDDPKDLIRLLEEYAKRDIGLPEPLYSRIVAMGEACAPALIRIVRNDDNAEDLRGTAMAILSDMQGQLPVDLCVDLVCRCGEEDVLGDRAADVLKRCDASIADELMARYDEATEDGRMLILEICSYFPGREDVYQALVHALNNDHDNRGFYAGLLAEYGDERAVEPLMQAYRLSDLEYLDYIEIRNAIEALGGDPGEERVFNGDPDYEALRNL